VLIEKGKEEGIKESIFRSKVDAVFKMIKKRFGNHTQWLAV